LEDEETREKPHLQQFRNLVHFIQSNLRIKLDLLLFYVNSSDVSQNMTRSTM